MLALDDFIGHVATSGLVAPAVIAEVSGQIDPEPSGRLLRRSTGAAADRRRLADDLSGEEAAFGRHPRVHPGRLPADAADR